MSRTANLIEFIKWNRTRTLGLLDSIEKASDPQAVLSFRPGPGRAHIGWQLMHIAVTEDIFATERLNPGKAPKHRDLWDRFRGGSTPDDQVPTAAEIRQTFADCRENLLETLADFNDDRLGEIPEALKARQLTMLDVLHILGWHEAHHQGQSHITFNLWKASQT